VTKSLESNFQKMAEQARHSAAGAINAHARLEFLRLADKLEAAAVAEEKAEFPGEDYIRWPFK
jgi:hypothetical protein